MESKIRKEDKEKGRGVKHKRQSEAVKWTGDIKSWQREQIERGMVVGCLFLL